MVFYTNPSDSHVFGLETNFGCCTANFHQGWPKFACSTFFRADDGITVASLVPAGLETCVKGVPITVEVSGEYPFRDTATVQVKAVVPVEFTLRIRIPGTCKGTAVSGQAAKPGAYYEWKKVWDGETELSVTLTQKAHLVKRPRDLACVQRARFFTCCLSGPGWSLWSMSGMAFRERLPSATGTCTPKHPGTMVSPPIPSRRKRILWTAQPFPDSIPQSPSRPEWRRFPGKWLMAYAQRNRTAGSLYPGQRKFCCTLTAVRTCE